MKAFRIISIVLFLGLGGTSAFFFHKTQKDNEQLAATEETVRQLQSKIDLLNVQMGKLNTDLDEQKAQTEKYKNEVLQLKGLQENLLVEKEKAEADSQKLKNERAALEAERAERQKQIEAQAALEENLRKTIASKDVVISNLEGKLKVNVANKILFASGSAELLPEGKQILEQIVKAVGTDGKEDVRIEGHTDNVPISVILAEKYPTNWELSTARATTALRYLQENCGMPEDRLSAVGYGESHPLAPNDTEENRAKNRRIEIILTPVSK